MARELFVDLTSRRLVASTRNAAPIAPGFVKGDDGVFTLYFLESSGVVGRPFNLVDKTAADVKLGIGLKNGVPRDGTYTLSFSAETTGDIPAAATAGAVQTALNSLSAISSAGGVTVTGAIEDQFTVRFNSAGTQSAITGSFNLLTPDSIALIDERIEGTATEREVQEIQIRLAPAVFQDTWANTESTVTGTLTRTVTGGTDVNETQLLTFSQTPDDGFFRLTFPSKTVTISTNVVSGFFVSDDPHGFREGQRIIITGFDAISGFNRGDNVYSTADVTPNSFRLRFYNFDEAASFGYSGQVVAINATATATTSPGLVSSRSGQTAPILVPFNATDIESALVRLEPIGSGGAQVTRDGNEFEIVFAGEKGGAEQPLLVLQNNTSVVPKKEAVVDFGTFALRDILHNEPEVDLDFEIELTEAGAKQTVVQTQCQVAEELIV
jgi:hypothetical protein